MVRSWVSRGVCTWSKVHNLCQFIAFFFSQIDPKIVIDAITNEQWLMVVLKELKQFEINQVWFLRTSLMKMA